VLKLKILILEHTSPPVNPTPTNKPTINPLLWYLNSSYPDIRLSNLNDLYRLHFSILNTSGIFNFTMFYHIRGQQRGRGVVAAAAAAAAMTIRTAAVCISSGVTSHLSEQLPSHTQTDECLTGIKICQWVKIINSHCTNTMSFSSSICCSYLLYMHHKLHFLHNTSSSHFCQSQKLKLASLTRF
jgi:hypothetical protein